jgi:hypothetical protein
MPKAGVEASRGSATVWRHGGGLMAGLEEPEVLDLLTLSRSREYVLIMIEERPWTESPDQVTQLSRKIDFYEAIIRDGALAAKLPESNGQTKRIQLHVSPNGAPDRPPGD